jgi:HSP20 family molecular chaperone IbpA
METIFDVISKMSGSAFRTPYHHTSGDKVFIEVPGFSKDDLEVSLEKNVLTVKGEKLIEGQKISIKKSVWCSATDPDLLTLKLEHGLLCVSLKEEVQKKKKIQIL